MGYGYVVDNVGKYNEIVPYTAFNARKNFIEENKNLINNFKKAIDKGLEYTLNNDSTTLAKDIIRQFPDTSLQDLETIIGRYKEADSWLTNTYISKEMFNNLQDMLINFKLINTIVPYQDLITNE